jgi:hypothetical protein
MCPCVMNSLLKASSRWPLPDLCCFAMACSPSRSADRPAALRERVSVRSQARCSAVRNPESTRVRSESRPSLNEPGLVSFLYLSILSPAGRRTIPVLRPFYPRIKKPPLVTDPMTAVSVPKSLHRPRTSQAASYGLTRSLCRLITAWIGSTVGAAVRVAVGMAAAMAPPAAKVSKYRRVGST